MTSLRWGSATDVGRVRSNNEDSLLVAEPLFAVADGMGGPAAGEVASAIAVEALRAGFQGERSRDSLAEAVRQANRAIFERARQDESLRGMGTTLTAVALVDEGGDDVLAVVNVGDSRAYRLRDGELEQLTEDHSLVEEMVRTGRLSVAEASGHPHRHILTRALGVEAEVEVDCFGVTPFAGDRYLLASDGLMNEVDDRDIASVLRRVADPDDAARELVDRARTGGGRDNITVVVLDVVDDDGRGERASQAVADLPPAPPRTEARPDTAEPAAPARPAAAPPPPAARPAAPAPPPPGRRLTLRAVLFVVALLAVLVGAVAAVGLYARASYYVGLDGDRVTIYQGRPGGLLWFDPTEAEPTSLTIDEVPAARRAAVRAGKTEPSLDDARRYVENLRDEAARTGTVAPPSPPATATPGP